MRARALGLLIFLATPALASCGDPVAGGTAVRLDVRELTSQAALVIEARVLSMVPVETDGLVQTEYLLEVDRTFAGVDESYRAIRLPGGVRPDGSGMLVAGMPRLRPGFEVLLFLTEESLNGMRMPVGLAQGKFDLVRLPDGTKRLARDTAGVNLVDAPGGSSRQTLQRALYDYAQVVADIEAALSEKRSR